MTEPSSRSPPVGRSRGFAWLVQKLWWVHSLWALGFGIAVIVYARRGAVTPDKLPSFLAVSWVVVFLALRFVVGSRDEPSAERLPRRGLRLVTNYVIKNLYQTMFFFLVPFYFASTSWSLTAANWWLAPLIVVCAVLSTMDLVMDNFIMRHRLLASVLYGLCLFSVLNLMLPITFGLSHATSLLLALAATAPAVAPLTFPLRVAFSRRGLLLTGMASALLTAAGWYGLPYVVPAPLALAGGAVSHGSEGSREIVGEHHDVIFADQLKGLRCTTWLTQPGGVHDAIDHVWLRRGRAWRTVRPTASSHPSKPGVVLKSRLPAVPADPEGPWRCDVRTADGQLVGQLEFVVAPAPSLPRVDVVDVVDVVDRRPALDGVIRVGAQLPTDP